MTSSQFTVHPLLENVRKSTDSEALQATMFQRVDANLAAHTMSKISPLAAMALRFRGKKKAGGLPNMGILTITPTSIRAYSCAGGGASMRPKEEVAVWQRADLQMEIEEKSGSRRLTLRSNREDESVTVEALQGFEQMTDEIMRALEAK